MAGKAENGGRRWRVWRVVPWVIAALILLLPLVAMQFTDEVAWDETDFAVMGAMLFSACGAYLPRRGRRRGRDGVHPRSISDVNE